MSSLVDGGQNILLHSSTRHQGHEFAKFKDLIDFFDGDDDVKTTATAASGLL